MAAVKKLVNDPSSAVDEAVDGLVMTTPTLVRLHGHQVVIRKDVDSVITGGRVAILSGGGSGHEPAMAGYVGSGMLTAAVAGAVFTSPPPTSILATIREIGRGNKAGVLLIVMNYTGDRLNFGLAQERARLEGIKVQMVVVGEDCALPITQKTAGRRGLCGTILIHKIAGAMADQGCSLEEIVAAAEAAANHMGTMSVSLTACSLPGKGPSFTLQEDEMELGLGIHGEAGVKRAKVQPADQVVAAMLDHLVSSQSYLSLKAGDRVAVVVNNLGGTSHLEMSIVARAAIQYLVQTKSVTVDRCYVGSYMTSLEMAGVSLTVLHVNDERLQCLDHPTDVPGWFHLSEPASFQHGQCLVKTRIPQAQPTHTLTAETDRDDQLGSVVQNLLKVVSDALINAEDDLNELDRGSGDGDCGSTLKRGAQAIVEALLSGAIPCSVPSQCLSTLADIVETNMGGSSGALYSIMLTAAAVHVNADATSEGLVEAFGIGVDAIMRYGLAQPGDRTMLDALVPAHETLRSQLMAKASLHDAVSEAAKAADRGAQATVKMSAHAGRASYVNVSQLMEPDPGAVAVAIWMSAAALALFPASVSVNVIAIVNWDLTVGNVISILDHDLHEFPGRHTLTSEKPPAAGSPASLSETRHVAEEKLTEWRKAFALIDRDRSGKISLRELQVLFTSIGHQVTHTQLQHMVASVDANRDGQIDLPEFLSMMSAQMESKEDDKEMIKAFQEFDKNGDGFITQEELKEVMHSTGDVLSDDELNAMIRSADSNKDGQVDFTEFAQLMKQH